VDLRQWILAVARAAKPAHPLGLTACAQRMSTLGNGLAEAWEANRLSQSRAAGPTPKDAPKDSFQYYISYCSFNF